MCSRRLNAALLFKHLFGSEGGFSTQPSFLTLRRQSLGPSTKRSFQQLAHHFNSLKSMQFVHPWTAPQNVLIGSHWPLSYFGGLAKCKNEMATKRKGTCGWQLLLMSSPPSAPEHTQHSYNTAHKYVDISLKVKRTLSTYKEVVARRVLVFIPK